MKRWSSLVLVAACAGADGSDAGDTDTDDTPPELVEPDCQRVRSGYGPDGDVPIRVEVVADGLEVPWALGWMPDGTMLVTERSGRIRRVTPSGELVAEPVATVDVTETGEDGLLGLAVAPDADQTGAFYVYYTADGGAGTVNRIARYLLDDDGAASLDEVVVDDIPAGRFHSGGRIRFGPDGMLWVGTGDALDPASSQDPDSLAGKILRYRPDGTIPDDNPTPGSPVYALGIRNVQAFDWRDDGALVLADHGPSGELGREGHDEVNWVPPGANLGWPDVYRCQSEPGLRAPSMTWADANPPGGLAIYRGDDIPGWQDDVIVGILGFGDDVGHLQRLRFDGVDVEVSEVYLQGDHGRLREVVMGPDGHLYVTTSNCDGRSSRCGDGDEILRVVGG